jgi:hypothetical protein
VAHLHCEFPDRSGDRQVYMATPETGGVLTAVADYELFAFNTNALDKESGCSN